MWPENLEPDHYEMMRVELGLKETPSTTDALRPLDGDAIKQRINTWFREQPLNGDEVDPDELITQANHHPWRSEQFPPLADWVDANTRPLDRLVEASRRPRFYSPSPTLLDNKSDPLIDMLLPGVQNMRVAARALEVRAMRNLGEGHLTEAWSDLIAIHRLARLTAQSHSLIEQIVAIALSNMACEGTVVLLDNHRITAGLARQINTDLAGLAPSHVVKCIDEFERIFALDAVIRIKREGVLPLVREIEALSATNHRDNHNSRKGADPTKNMLSNWNASLERVNFWYDRLVAVMRMPRGNARKKALAQFEAGLLADGQRIKQPVPLIAAMLSLKVRGELVGALVACLMTPGMEVATTAEDRANTTLQLTRLAGALAVYRAQHKTYPLRLADLVPGTVEQLPVDIYNSNAFVYKRTSDGYLLYSLGENGRDDAGSNQTLDAYEGIPLKDLDQDEAATIRDKIPHNTDDVSIRVPVRKFELPAPRPTE